MFKVKVFTIGKIKEHWLEEALQEYEKRLSQSLHIDWFLYKNDEKLIDAVKKESFFIALDPQGKMVDSQEFCKNFFSLLQSHKLTLSFVIGGPLGLPQTLRSPKKPSWSLSRLTFTHQICRLLLIEQIYRSFEILKGSEYHK